MYSFCPCRCSSGWRCAASACCVSRPPSTEHSGRHVLSAVSVCGVWCVVSLSIYLSIYISIYIYLSNPEANENVCLTIRSDVWLEWGSGWFGEHRDILPHPHTAMAAPSTDISRKSGRTVCVCVCVCSR